jgi:threonine dehydrogenase-like Zn-dependent dehydrogenase
MLNDENGQLGGLCGSDLHVYRGHEDVEEPYATPSTPMCGHEFIGEIVALGSSFGANSQGRSELYSSLKVGDKVLSPFTVSCGEC